MNTTCKVCGHSGENMWRDGKYYCAICGSEIDVAQPGVHAEAPTSIVATCPVCKNTENNIFKNGKWYCSLCGTEFDLNTPPPTNTQPGTPVYPGMLNSENAVAARRAELEKQRDRQLGWGIFWLIIFWPVGAYFLYKFYKTCTELKKF